MVGGQSSSHHFLCAIEVDYAKGLVHQGAAADREILSGDKASLF